MNMAIAEDKNEMEIKRNTQIQGDIEYLKKKKEKNLFKCKCTISLSRSENCRIIIIKIISLYYI